MDDQDKFDYEKFAETVVRYRYDLRKERQVKQKIMKALSNIGAATLHLVSHIEPHFEDAEPTDKERSIVTADLINDAVFVNAGKRRLTFMILYGVGSDRKLPSSRGERCGQIGAYFHFAEDDQAKLFTRLSIYGNGDVTDGKNTWNTSEGYESFLPFVAETIEKTLFSPDLIWLPDAELERPFSPAPVEDGKLLIDFLRRNAVSFNVDGQE